MTDTLRALQRTNIMKYEENGIILHALEVIHSSTCLYYLIQMVDRIIRDLKLAL